MAQRTRSRASLTSVSAKPTNVKLGRPLAKCTSTVTAGACKPKRARLCTSASDIQLPFPSDLPIAGRLIRSDAPTLCAKMVESSDYRITLGHGSCEVSSFVKKHLGTDSAK